MRIKIGKVWYKCEVGQPIMIELTDVDKKNLASMAHDATKYALFHDEELLSEEDMYKWMDEEEVEVTKACPQCDFGVGGHEPDCPKNQSNPETYDGDTE